MSCYDYNAQETGKYTKPEYTTDMQNHNFRNKA